MKLRIPKKDQYKLKKHKFSLRELINKAIVRKYVFNHSVYSRSLVMEYKGLSEIILVDRYGETFTFIMSIPDAKDLARQINKIKK